MPTLTTVLLVKTLNINEGFFKELNRKNVNKTIAIFEKGAEEIGKNITPIIKKITIDGGTFSKKFSSDGLLLNPRKIKQPADISQNLVGIKKYAAGWLIG